jgi:hypothetical protein
VQLDMRPRTPSRYSRLREHLPNAARTHGWVEYMSC